MAQKDAQFENGGTCMIAPVSPADSRTGMNEARVEELILETRRVTIREPSAVLELPIRTVHNTYHKWPISTVT